MITGKTIDFTRQIFVGKVMSLLFNMLSRLVITFLPRSKCLLISWFQVPSAVILEPKKMKSATVSTVSPSICHEVMGPDAMILVFWMFSFKPNFSLSSFSFIKRLFSSSSLSAIRVVSSAYLRLLIFPPATRPSRTNTQKRCPFHYRGLQCKSRKSRNTWSNRQVWPWRTEWSRAKANRVLPRECTGNGKHPLPATQKKTTHGQHKMVNTEIRLIIFFAAKDGEALYSQ